MSEWTLGVVIQRRALDFYSQVQFPLWLFDFLLRFLKLLIANKNRAVQTNEICVRHSTRRRTRNLHSKDEKATTN